MEDLKKFIAIGGTIIIVLLCYLNYQLHISVKPELSGLPIGAELHATSTTLTAQIIDLNSSSDATTAIFGTVTVSSSSPAALNIWNATGTNDMASSLVTTLPAGISAGTYVYDVIFDRGLVIEKAVNFNGDYVITYR